jgi:hypothetical protein
MHLHGTEFDPRLAPFGVSAAAVVIQYGPTGPGLLCGRRFNFTDHYGGAEITVKSSFGPHRVSGAVSYSKPGCCHFTGQHWSATGRAGEVPPPAAGQDTPVCSTHRPHTQLASQVECLLHRLEAERRAVALPG